MTPPTPTIQAMLDEAERAATHLHNAIDFLNRCPNECLGLDPELGYSYRDELTTRLGFVADTIANITKHLEARDGK